MRCCYCLILQALAIPGPRETEILPQESSILWNSDFISENLKNFFTFPAVQKVVSGIPDMIELFKDQVLRSGAIAEITAEASESIKSSLEAYENFFTKFQIGFIDFFTSLVDLPAYIISHDTKL